MPVRFWIEVDGERRLADDLRRFGMRSREFKAGVRAAANLVRREVRRRTPRDTGRTRRSWRVRLRLQPEGWGARVYPRGRESKRGRAHIVRWLEYGTAEAMRARPVKPREAKVMRFWTRAGELVFTHKARAVHRATPPRGFMQAAIQITADDIAGLLGDAWAPRLFQRRAGVLEEFALRVGGRL